MTAPAIGRAYVLTVPARTSGRHRLAPHPLVARASNVARTVLASKTVRLAFGVAEGFAVVALPLAIALAPYLGGR